MIVSDIFYLALRALSVTQGAGQAPSADELNDCLLVLNNMLDAWRADRLTIYHVERTVVNLVSGQQAYTIGPGGDFNLPRPLWIQDAGVISNNNPAQPLELPMALLNDDEWAGVTVKNVPSALSWYLYYDYGFDANGRGTMQVWPIPNVSNIQMALYLPTPMTSNFASVTSTISLPPAYERAIRYNLAVELAPMFAKRGAILSPVVVEMATRSYADIERANKRLVFLEVDHALQGGQNRLAWNWLTGTQGARTI